MINEIRTLYLGSWNKGFGSKFRLGSRAQQEISEEGWRTHRSTRYEYNIKGIDINPNTLNDKNYRVLSKNLDKWYIYIYIYICVCVCGLAAVVHLIMFD